MQWSGVGVVLAGAAWVVAGCTPGGSTYDAPWTLLRASPNSSVAVVAYFHGSCDSLTSVDTSATSTTVTFTIRVHEPSGTCDAAGRTTAIRIRLGAKLGDRTVTGACHEEQGILCATRSELKTMDLRDLPIYGP